MSSRDSGRSLVRAAPRYPSVVGTAAGHGRDSPLQASLCQDNPKEPRPLTPLFSKLNLKSADSLLVLNAPESFATEVHALPPAITVLSDARAKGEPVAFALAFATRQVEVDRFAPVLAARALGDAVVWIAYPKSTSKNYRCDFNRDKGWATLGELGFEPVRQVAIDDDWSALRFRRVEFIKTLTRPASMALTKAGRERLK